MSIFANLTPKEKLIIRTYEIDLTLYEKLEHISKELYDVSISKLVNLCIEQLILSKKVIPYSKPKNETTVTRSFGIKENIYNGLIKLRNEYDISFNRLINIAIYNVLVEEGILKIKN